MRITKQQVLDALTTEPLGAFGSFIQYANTPDCQVCAVGAVVRSAVKGRVDEANVYSISNASTTGGLCALEPSEGFLNEDEQSPSTFNEAVERALKLKKQHHMDHLSVLSALYEWHDGREVAIGTIRRRLKKFVAEHFPKTIRLEGI